ncbi:MAG TPA: TonB-dependent receptor [Sphingobium sp.]
MAFRLGARSNRVFRFLGSSAVLGALALPVAAHAQQASAPVETAAQATEETDASIGDIVVTATRDRQPMQRVPISMQALNMEKLEERQVKGLSDFAALMPSVSFAGIGPGRNEVYFRGIVPAGGNYAAVGFYLDDIPITGQEVPDIHVYDMERVEALAGPQGTLYGAGSLAGTIRFITNKPKLDKFEFGYDLEGNKYGPGGYGGQLESYINVPIGETMAIRAMGYYRKDGGYIDNKANNGLLNDGSSATLNLGDNNPTTSYTLNNASIAKDNYNPIYEYGGRVQLLWEPDPGWQLTPSITAQRQISYGYFGYDPRVGDLAVHDFDLTRQDDKWYQASLSIHGHIGDWDIVSATGYFHRRTELRNDYSYYTVTYDGFGPGYESYLQFFDKSGCTGTGAAQKCSKLLNPTQYYHGDTYRDKFTQELRISTPKSWPFDVTVGGFYHHQKQKTNTYYAIHGLDDTQGFTQAGGGDVAGGLIGVPAMYAIGYNQDGIKGTPDDSVPYFTNTVINPNGNPLGTMALGTMAVKGDGFYVVEQDQRFNDKAIFAEGHYNITPKLRLTGGIRYFWTDFSNVGFAGVQSSAAALGCSVPLAAARITCVNTNPLAADGTGRYKEEGETHKVAVNWQITPSKMVYANYSTGFRPGGFNRPLRIRSTGQLATVAPYKSETLSNFELGLKTTWANKFRFNAAIYYEKWDNIQYSVVVSGAQGAGMTGNAGKARVYGIEYDSDLKLGKVTISSAGAYNDAKLAGNFCNFAYNTGTASIAQLSSCTPGVLFGDPEVEEVAARDGTRLPRQAKFKGTTSIRYDTEISGYRSYIMGAASYQTSTTQDLNVQNNNLLACPGTVADANAATAAGRVCTTPGFVSFDFSAGIKKDNWHLDLFIQNAFDRRGNLTTNTFCSITFCSGSARSFPIRPQFMGIKFGQSF